MNKEELDEIETLEIDFKDTDELSLALEVSSKKAIYLIDDLIEHLFKVQDENKQLKERIDTLKETQLKQLQIIKEKDEIINKTTEYIDGCLLVGHTFGNEEIDNALDGEYNYIKKLLGE